MVKKKSFWLILLTVLTAVVLAFCACGLVGCSSEPDEDDTKTEGNEGGGSGSGDSSSSGSGSGDSSSSGSGSGDSSSSGGSGSGDSGVLFVLQGYYDALGTDYWGVITFNADGSGYFGTYYQDTGEPFSMFCGDIEWEYTDEDNMEIEATMSIMGQPAYFPIVLAAVNGQVVAGTMYIEEVQSEAILYIDTAVGALVSKDLIGDTHANIVLYDDYTCAVEIEGEAETGEWEYTDEGAGVSLAVDSKSYTATIEVNDKGQITEAVFAEFEGVTSAVFLPIGTVDYTLYSFVSNEGYTLIMNDDGTFETTVGDTTYTGVGSTSTLALADDDNDTTYTPTITYGTDDEGNQYIESVTYATYFGGKTNVTFTLPENITTREDNANYQKYYNSETHGEAIAVIIGTSYIDETDDVTDETTTTDYDGEEYWIFLYRDGAMSAHVGENTTSFASDGYWSWSANSDGDLVPTFNRSSNGSYIAYQAVYDETSGTWTARIENMSTSIFGNYYVYTFETEEFPAGAFEGTVAGDDENTYYLVLYMDGTFKAHLGATNTSDGYWQNTETGIEFGKLSADYSGGYPPTYTYVECSSTTNSDGTVSVVITNYSGTEYTYIVDPSIVPIGGYDLSEFADAT